MSFFFYIKLNLTTFVDDDRQAVSHHSFSLKCLQPNKTFRRPVSTITNSTCRNSYTGYITELYFYKINYRTVRRPGFSDIIEIFLPVFDYSSTITLITFYPVRYPLILYGIV